MNQGDIDFLRVISPILVGIIAFSLPRIVRAAIAGQFAECLKGEIERMAAHNVDEESHPRLRIVTEFETRIEKALEEFRYEFRQEIEKLSEQIKNSRCEYAHDEPKAASKKRKR